MGWLQPQLLVVDSAETPGTLWSIYEGFPLAIEKSNVLFDIPCFLGKIAFGTPDAIKSSYESLSDESIVASFQSYSNILDNGSGRLARYAGESPDIFVAVVRDTFQQWMRQGINGQVSIDTGYSMKQWMFHLLKVHAATWAGWPHDAQRKMAGILDMDDLYIGYTDARSRLLCGADIGSGVDIRRFVEDRPAKTNSIALLSMSGDDVTHEHVSIPLFETGNRETSRAVESAIFCLTSSLHSLRSLSDSLGVEPGYRNAAALHPY